MLQKSKSKKIWQLKYLLLLPIVVGMLIYTSLEGQETTTQENDKDQELIEKIKEEVIKDIENSGFIRASFSNYDSVNPILSKEDFFRTQILWQEMTKEINRKNNKGALKSNLKELDDPSTSQYNSYVNRTKAFQLIDKNLDISIDIGRYDVILIKQRDINANDSYVLKVVDITDLTSDEIRSFNRKMKGVFEKESTYDNIVLTDNTNVVRISKKVRNYNILRSAIPEKNVEEKYNQLLKERGRLLKNSNEKNPIIINLDQQLQGLKRQMQFDQDTIVPFAIVDEPPIFPGCENVSDKRVCFKKTLKQHISKNFRYPGEAQKVGVQGRVNILFTIDSQGDIADIRMRGPHKILEDEALRIIQLIPQLKPGIHKGRKVNVPFSIPITFKLNGDNSKNTNSKSLHDFKLLPSNIKGANLKLKNLVNQYNHLALERKRLLVKSSEENPILTNLNNQLRVLEDQIYESGLYDAIPRNTAAKNEKQGPQDIKDYIEDVPFAVIDEVPIFPGCVNEQNQRNCFQSKLQNHISKNFRYPKEAQELGIQGRVSIMFTIDQGGNITDIRKRGPHKLLENEAERIISLLPKMTPGKHRGKLVKVPFSLPITFKLHSKTENESVNSANTQKIAYKGMSVFAKTDTIGDGKRVYGMVTDKAKLPLPGVNITIEGSAKGSISDFDGNFEIEVKKGDVLVFQFIGLPTLKLKITDEKEYQIFVKE